MKVNARNLVHIFGLTTIVLASCTEGGPMSVEATSRGYSSTAEGTQTWYCVYKIESESLRNEDTVFISAGGSEVQTERVGRQPETTQVALSVKLKNNL
jgi:hypothetical protein